MADRYSLRIDEDGDVYLMDAETEDCIRLGHVDGCKTHGKCPLNLRPEFDRLEEEWREDRAERERIGDGDRRCWESGYIASRGV